MGKARSQTVVDLSPEEAFDLWTDTSRWRTFIDGFAHVDRIVGEWPEPGAKLVWQSVPTGRGVVTERVVTSEPGRRFATAILEERATGTQTVEFGAAPDEEGGGTAVAIELDYTVQRGGPLRAVVDFLFINRVQREALARTLRRFRTEAAEEAAL